MTLVVSSSRDTKKSPDEVKMKKTANKSEFKPFQVKQVAFIVLLNLSDALG